METRVVNVKKEGFCGTAACAIGYCPVAFPRVFKYENKCGFFEVVSRKTGEHDFKAVAEYFGIEPWDVNKIALYYNYPRSKKVTPKMVATKIRNLVKDLTQR